MRILLGALAVALLAAFPAHAQTAVNSASCSNFAAPPTLPDGATASRPAMVRSGDAVEAWRAARETKLTQCLADIQALRAQLNAMEAAYNQAGVERNAVLGAWNAEAAEFSGRGQARRAGGAQGAQ